MRGLRVVVIGTGVVTLALTGCGDDGEGGDDANAIEVSADEFKYSPSEWTVDAGEFSLEFTNEGGTEHEFVILNEEIGSEDAFTEDQVIDETEAESGETVSHTFTLEEPGTYQVICAIQGHFNSGMAGTLTVE